MENLNPSKRLVAYGLLIFFIIGCTEQDIETEAEKAVRLLSNNSDKHWIIEQILWDDVNEVLSSCDSSLILTISADNTWKEVFLQLSCYNTSEGSWSLNDENTVLSIAFINQNTGKESTKDFEINELSDKLFEYQEVASNKIKRVRMVELGKL